MLAHITVKPGTEERWEALCRRLYDGTHASEPQMLRYEYWRGQEPRSYYCSLAFDDHRAFIEHQVSDHHETESPSIGSCLESFRLEFLDPVEGASALPPTEHQPAPDGSDELTSKNTERYRARVADWWLALR